jgi:hypothetical protein
MPYLRIFVGLLERSNLITLPEKARQALRDLLSSAVINVVTACSLSTLASCASIGGPYREGCRVELRRR